MRDFNQVVCILLDPERGISSMNRIKTKPRNSLKATTLDQLIRITNEAPVKYKKNSEKSNRARFLKELDLDNVVTRFRKMLPQKAPLYIGH